jgi:DNA-binding transcriptional LysR family regulator
MHVKSLKVFCDVVGRRSFSQAASENGLSQSGVSQIIHQMEENLGVRLIDRSKRPFVLTAEGELYYEGCRKLVHRYWALVEEVKTLHHYVEGRVHVASIYSVGLSYGKQLIEQFTERYSNTTVHMEYHHPDRVYELVGEGQVDIGLVSYAQTTRSITAIPWREESVILVCSPTHPLATHQRVTAVDIDGLRIIGFDRGLTIRRNIDRQLGKFGIAVETAIAFDNVDTIKRAIVVNAGASFLPAPSVQCELSTGDLVAVCLEDVSLTRPLGIIHRRGIEPGQTAQRFIELLTGAAYSESTAAERRRASSPKAASGKKDTKVSVKLGSRRT